MAKSSQPDKPKAKTETVIDQDQVLRIAQLAQLDIPKDQIAHYLRDLNQILGHLQNLADIETSDVAPLSHAIAEKHDFGKDEPLESLGSNKALENAPESDQGHFRIPTVLD